MIVNNEEEMLKFGEDFFKDLKLPAVIELIGDVGAGKTTFTRGLAKGMGINEPVTSPSFMISKKYAGKYGNLTHYDFYRLDDPGIMVEDLREAMMEDDSVVVIEWGNDIEGILPENRKMIKIEFRDDDSREIII